MQGFYMKEVQLKQRSIAYLKTIISVSGYRCLCIVVLLAQEIFFVLISVSGKIL